MVETKPAFLHLLWQLGETLVNRWPRTEMLQALWLTMTQRLLKVEPAFVVDVVVEVDVYTRGSVGGQKPTSLGQRIAVGGRVNEEYPDGERSFQQTLDGIIGISCLRTNIFTCEPVVRVAYHIEDTPFQHDACGLEHGRSPGDELRQPLRVECRQRLFAIPFF